MVTSSHTDYSGPVGWGGMVTYFCTPSHTNRMKEKCGGAGWDGNVFSLAHWIVTLTPGKLGVGWGGMARRNFICKQRTAQTNIQGWGRVVRYYFCSCARVYAMLSTSSVHVCTESPNVSSLTRKVRSTCGQMKSKNTHIDNGQ